MAYSVRYEMPEERVSPFVTTLGVSVRVVAGLAEVFGVALCLAACATPRNALEVEAQQCESFSAFDASVREGIDEALAHTPGPELVAQTSRLNRARRLCARHVVSTLRALREARGVEAIQLELDAMTATWSAQTVRALLIEQLGAEAVDLEPLLAESDQRSARAAHETRLARAEPDAFQASRACEAIGACERLSCEGQPQADLERAAKSCLAQAAARDAPGRAAASREVLKRLPTTPSAARTEAALMRESAQRVVWLQVDEAMGDGHWGTAAQLATSLGPSARADDVRAQALRHHLARAQALSAFPDAAWLHRRLAEDFGGPHAEPSTRHGRWESPRWRCPGTPPSLPTLPAGLTGMLAARCDAPKAEAAPHTKDEALRTFELESELRQHHVTATLSLSCADQRFVLPLMVEDAEAVPAEVQRVVQETLVTCSHAPAAAQSCALLTQDSAVVLERFVALARFTRRWEPCFVEWLEQQEGTSPPALPDAAVRE
jgi:hypothetical protein